MTDFHGEVLGPNPFCDRLLKSIVASEAVSFNSKHLIPLLPDLIRPEHELILGEAFRNHDFQIAELFEVWLRKMGQSRKEPWIRDKRQLKALFNRFVKDQDKAFDRILPRLRELSPEVSRSRTKTLLTSEFAEINGQRYEFLRLMKERDYSKVHLTRRDAALFVVKEFINNLEHFHLQKRLFQFLSDENIKAAQLVSTDSDSKRVVLSFHDGLSIEDIQDLVDRELLPLEALEAFSFQHARFYNQLMHRLRSSYLARFDAGPVSLDPNISRVVFDPFEASWIIVDML